MSCLNPLLTALSLAFENRSNHIADDGNMAVRNRTDWREKERRRIEEYNREHFPEETK